MLPENAAPRPHPMGCWAVPLGKRVEHAASADVAAVNPRGGANQTCALLAGLEEGFVHMQDGRKYR
ncbi:hypothetical protein AM571_CH01302 [Rhizobium etli 8C-3]|uniref:Uncharacterized protein n=1 Tax=Rhizobium etli 8C-3 TaxID=538025 RepID=A0A1L5P1X7_RHIET|nr:hypothetical protein AM571_CH01302 [Rhizobium etli 8C-3]